MSKAIEKQSLPSLDTSKSGQIKRGKGGRFIKGTKPSPGPGRPSRAIESTYFETLKANLTQERWAEVCIKVIKLAESGDLRAFETLCKYLIPPQEQRFAVKEQPETELRFAGRDRVKMIEEAIQTLQNHLSRLKGCRDSYKCSSPDNSDDA